METKENELIASRMDKYNVLLEKGINPYKNKYERTHLAEEILESFDSLEDENVKISGRIMSLRVHGKAAFAHIQDRSGQIQVYARINKIGEEKYESFTNLDTGDIVGVEGRVFRTRRGEITVEIKELELLTKSLRPLPEKWHGLQDVELRYRQRYLDLIVNSEAREVFEKRSKIIASMRRQMDERGFLEVETPMMHSIPGGAAARPFITHHNALDMDLYMRIAPELYLKRLLVGGMEKVYEINKNFRNEGISTRHNPEFTMVEIYQAYADYEDMMKLVEDVISKIALEVLGDTSITYQGSEIDLSPPWDRITMVDCIKEHTGLDFAGLSDEEARKIAKGAGIEVEEGSTWGQVMYEVFEERVEDKLMGPVFVKDFPVEVSPLAKRKASEDNLVYRFEGFIGGIEITNAFSELNDPTDQKSRFVQQSQARQSGDDEAHMYDKDFVEALEYGMPPAGGVGIGIDRLIMILTDSASIREVILFPLLKPRDQKVNGDLQDMK